MIPLVACCLAFSFVLMRQTTPRVALRPGQYRAPQAPYWPDCVPVSERYESVTVIDKQRATRIVEVFGGRRELLWKAR